MVPLVCWLLVVVSAGKCNGVWLRLLMLLLSLMLLLLPRPLFLFCQEKWLSSVSVESVEGLHDGTVNKPEVSVVEAGEEVFIKS